MQRIDVEAARARFLAKVDKGHEFTPENTKIERRPRTGILRRSCKACAREYGRLYRARGGRRKAA